MAKMKATKKSSTKPDAGKGVLKALSELKARVSLLPESTNYIPKYAVTMPDGRKARLTNQYTGGWKVRIEGKTYQTYSFAPTVAVLQGKRVTLKMLTPRSARSTTA